MLPGMKLTKAGLNLLAKALTGKELKFTRGYTGDGILPDGTEITDLTDLISRKRELPIQSIETGEHTGTARINLEMTNAGLSEGFFLREYGLFAEDPDTEEEILYSYRNVAENAGYLPGQDGSDAVNYVLTLMTVIDQAEHVTAYIESSDNYVTYSLMESRFNTMFRDPDNIDYFWTHKEGDVQKFRPSSLQAVRDVIIGRYDAFNQNGRIETVENAICQMLLTFEDMRQYPDYMNFIVENFNDTNQIDTTRINVTRALEGDDSVDVETLWGLITGSMYTLTDGLNSETVIIKTINRENNILRVILTRPIEHVYNLETTYLTRSNVDIYPGRAATIGSGTDEAVTWYANIDWSGIGSQEEFNVSADVKISEITLYDISGDANINSSGYITLS